MGWAFCGTDDLGREIGYGVSATCDFPGCGEPIDRGLAYLCGPEHNPDTWGCGRYFCERHRYSHACPFPAPDDEDDGEPCPDGEHVWTGQQVGGAPDMAESTEWVEYCSVCGMENPGSWVWPEPTVTVACSPQDFL